MAAALKVWTVELSLSLSSLLASIQPYIAHGRILRFDWAVTVMRTLSPFQEGCSTFFFNRNPSGSNRTGLNERIRTDVISTAAQEQVGL